jgi:hypothetical protein
VLAQGNQELTQPKVPLEQLLNRDGTLNLENGFRGSLDPTGWQMTTGPNGEPRFVPASAAQPSGGAQLMTVPGDANWDGRFDLLGLTGGYPGIVEAIAVRGGGDVDTVYVGGSFTNAGGVSVKGIAKWDGTSWLDVGGGVTGPGTTSVYAIAVAPDGSVYVGGGFDKAGGVEGMRNIAKWNGSNWERLGYGVSGGVGAIAVAPDGAVYVGGSFMEAYNCNPNECDPRPNCCKVSVNRIAKWNGTQWSEVAGGVAVGELGQVHALAVSGNDENYSVYVGGSFTSAGRAPNSVQSKSIAKWNGQRPQWFIHGRRHRHKWK